MPARFCLLLACLLTAFPAIGANVLLITAGSTPTSQEALRQTTFTGWGHTVTTLAATSTQSQYDTALSGVDVAWVTEEVLSSNVGYKLRETTAGVVSGEPFLDNELGISTSDGYEEGSTNQVFVTSNSNLVSSELSTGFITIFTSTQPRSLANPTTASGLTVLATGSSGDPALAVLEAGATLANTYNSNSTASGRRVRLPWGGNSFDWSSLDSDGLSIARNAIDWAAGGGGSAPTSLEARWKLDESSGTTAADSGDDGLDGVYSGGVSLAQGGPYPGVEGASFDGSDDHVDLPDLNADFSGGYTIAVWVNPSTLASSGDYQAFLNMSNGTNDDEIWFGWVGSSGLQLYVTDTTDGNWGHTIEDNTGFTLGEWVHCVATVDSSGYGTLYRNGKVTKSGFYMSFPQSVTRTENTIATSPWDDPFSGGLHDVRVYSRTLSQEEVSELYGLVGHWKLDETSGTTAYDSSGCDHDGDYAGGVTLNNEGPRGSAVDFDGVDGEVTSFEAGDALDASEAVSLAGWVRLDSLGASSVRLAGNGRSEGFRLEVTSAGLPKFHIHADIGKRDVTATDAIELDRWTHLAGIYDGTSLKIYIDGVLNRTSSVTAGSLVDNSHAFIIGNSTSGSNALDGELDDIVAYNRAMSDREIAEHYGLVGWWRMEETSGTDVADSSGAGNHGTIAGSATWSTDAKEGDGSLSLDGADYVEIPSSLVDGEDGVTLAGWARLTDTGSSGAVLIDIGNLFGITLDHANTSRGTNTYGYTGSGFEFLSTAAYYEDTGWRHYATVFDADTDQTSLYVDGVLQASMSLAGPIALEYAVDRTKLGDYGSGSSWRLTGEIDDMRVYNRALTADEIQALSGSSSAGVRIVRWVEIANP